ncbi:hypothetical protein OAN307_c39340 [Octadecabacter antarcticus 307]|uniref:Uncharacterized protein n=1 Tax=Octadecabacter antarcticus 307 TaxID=391626 RepID=M9RC74_9RHOB|nr:hypothetical protein [Octadecabacter antarcticus]AGI69363.1 hypothetical protein OAN307_c39340 [Octadecabacter antarcticus 307]
MLLQLQPSVETLFLWLCSDPGTNLAFAALCVWAATGRTPYWCALIGAAIHLALALA